MPKNIIWKKYISGVTKFFNKLKGKKGMYLQSSQGLMFEDETPDKRFNLYEGVCDFLITENDYRKMASVLGVEAIFPVSGYKVRVGVAELFNEKEVLKKIEEAIDPFKGIHDKVISEYLNVAEKKYSEYVIYEDLYGMINIGDKSKSSDVDGFLISSGKII